MSARSELRFGSAAAIIHKPTRRGFEAFNTSPDFTVSCPVNPGSFGLAVATETELLRLALKAYEAASEPELWPGFLKRYAETVSADSAFLQIHDLAGHTSTIVGGFGISSPLKQAYNEHV